MGLVTGLLGGMWLAPVRGVVWIAGVLRDEAEAQLYDPARLRAEMEELDRARREGTLSPEECDAREDALLQRWMGRPG